MFVINDEIMHTQEDEIACQVEASAQSVDEPGEVAGQPILHTIGNTIQEVMESCGQDDE